MHPATFIIVFDLSALVDNVFQKCAERRSTQISQKKDHGLYIRTGLAPIRVLDIFYLEAVSLPTGS